MTVQLKKPLASHVPIRAVNADNFAAQLKAAAPSTQQWLKSTGFTGAPDTHALVPNGTGQLAEVWAGVRSATHPFALAALPRSLPPGNYCLAPDGLAVDDEAAALSWELGGYVF